MTLHDTSTGGILGTPETEADVLRLADFMGATFHAADFSGPSRFYIASTAFDGRFISFRVTIGTWIHFDGPTVPANEDAGTARG